MKWTKNTMVSWTHTLPSIHSKASLLAGITSLFSHCLQHHSCLCNGYLLTYYLCWVYIAIGICFFKLIVKKVHKTSLGDLIETLFLFNLTILAYGTSYVREIKGNQYILANFSMSIVFILFLTIVCFHTHKYVPKRQMYG